MRITSDVDISNRLLPSFNMKSKGKAAKSQLSVGRKPGEKDGEIYLMIATKQDRNGTRYRLKGNVEQIFGKFIQDGKATIRLKEPPHDICISKADPVQVKGFLGVIRMSHQGQGLDKVRLTNLAPVSTKTADNLKTKLTVGRKQDYPITTNFPHSLETLVVGNCKLKRFDSRMLKLQNLRRLDLGDNCITAIPDNIDDLQNLVELKLSGNKITDLPRGLCLGKLKHKLTLLDLTNNQLKFLRPWIIEMKALVTLKVDNNEILGLPVQIGALNNLRIFTAAQNKIKKLPGTFQKLRLDTLDLFGNPFEAVAESLPVQTQGFPTLQEVAARFIVKSRLPYTVDDVGPLMSYLDSPKFCLCGSPCFQYSFHYSAKLDLHKVTASATAVDLHGTMWAPMDGYLCSLRCYTKLAKYLGYTVS